MFILIISLLFLPVYFFGQVQKDSVIADKSDHHKKYIVGDRIITCDDCIVDFCGNLLSPKNDTIAKDTRALNSNDAPLYFTTTNILLSTMSAKQLIKQNKIASLSVLKCNAGRQLFGDVAKYGIILIELKDTSIKTENLIEFLNKSHPGNNIQIESILINGLKTTDSKIKIPKWEKLILDFDAKRNIYNIKP